MFPSHSQGIEPSTLGVGGWLATATSSQYLLLPSDLPVYAHGSISYRSTPVLKIKMKENSPSTFMASNMCRYTQFKPITRKQSKQINKTFQLLSSYLRSLNINPELQEYAILLAKNIRKFAIYIYERVLAFIFKELHCSTSRCNAIINEKWKLTICKCCTTNKYLVQSRSMSEMHINDASTVIRVGPN